MGEVCKQVYVHIIRNGVVGTGKVKVKFLLVFCEVLPLCFSLCNFSFYFYFVLGYN